MRNLGGAIAIASCGTILNDRLNLHFLRLAERLTSVNVQAANLTHGMTTRYAALWSDPVHAQAAALKRLWLLAYREALVLTFGDAYLAIGACFTLAVVMVPLMRKVKPPSTPSPDAH